MDSSSKTRKGFYIEQSDSKTKPSGVGWMRDVRRQCWIRHRKSANPIGPEGGHPISTSETTVESCPGTPSPTPSSKLEKTNSIGSVVTHASGAVREDKTMKPRPDLICTYMIEALGYQLGNGAIIHGERNWELGIADNSYLEGLHRHVMLLTRGENNEDHASAVVFNIMGLRRNAELGQAGGTPVNIFTLKQWKDKMNGN